jgi:Domain of unknown function (DUF4129)
VKVLAHRNARFLSFWVAAAPLLLCFLFSSRARAANAPMSLPAYEVELDRWSALVDRAYLQPGEIPEMLDTLPSSWPVEANGTEFDVSTSWLADGLEQMQAKAGEAPAIRRRLTIRLRALRAEAEGLASAGSPEPMGAARAQLNGIFREREFRESGPTWAEYARQWAVERIERMFSWVLSRLHLRAPAGDAVGWIVAVLAFLAFLVLVRWSLGRLRRRTGLEPAPAGTEIAADSLDWLADALEAAGRGDYRRAVHSAYWAAVARLEVLKVFPPDRSRTPRETLRQVPAGDARLAPLARLTDSFERVWYGLRPAGPNDWAETQARLEEMGCGARSTPLTAGS